ncbi:MAG TPA: ATP phosphoribosyltransferase [Thermoanaerobaculia bacterium]|nr:ATP phosphoribosyltransferase [Thermoanaerobaculia bacterium]
MIRLALPKGRNLAVARAALAAGGLDLGSLASDQRALRFLLPAAGIEILMLKDKDLPLYVEEGVADLGVVGSDVVGEVDGDLLVPLRLVGGRCRLSLIGRPETVPRPGDHLRLATKYPRLAQRLLAPKPWTAEIFELSGSVELAPILDLADCAVDIVQTGRTLAAHGLAELEILTEVDPLVVVNRASYQRHRSALCALFARLEAAGVAE